MCGRPSNSSASPSSTTVATSISQNTSWNGVEIHLCARTWRMLTAQQKAPSRISPLPSTALLSLQSKASGLNITANPATPMPTPAARRAVMRSPRNKRAPGTTHSGAV